eukprot:CAMPEP_0179962382 /NCGR_PEP_ID=MMETSP0983-20121128/30198_1 /TAXON_ID=483367 /ORGANISM="non described non described, Strain CCMP 2436" /LENGTH=243 /DNA_ID=CAMNT_0021874903 /DNA_START=306 /DNA_END=1035 /DNA_ORIENTATION=+
MSQTFLSVILPIFPGAEAAGASVRAIRAGGVDIESRRPKARVGFGLCAAVVERALYKPPTEAADRALVDSRPLSSGRLNKADPTVGGSAAPGVVLGRAVAGRAANALRPLRRKAPAIFAAAPTDERRMCPRPAASPAAGEVGTDCAAGRRSAGPGPVPEARGENCDDTRGDAAGSPKAVAGATRCAPLSAGEPGRSAAATAGSSAERLAELASPSGRRRRLRAAADRPQAAAHGRGLVGRAAR